MKSDKVLVRANIDLVPGIVKVSPLDQYMVRVILPMMCVFKVDSPTLRPEILHNLQSGLASTIDEINFIAATIIPEDGDRDTIQLEFTEESGVWFHWQEIPDIDYESLAQRNFPSSEFSVFQFIPEPRGHSKKCPVMTAQATFITGGLVLAFNGHHGVMDAQGFGTFAQIWAKHTAAESEGLIILSGERLPYDSLDGSSIFASVSKRPLADFPTYQVAEERKYEATQSRILKTAVAGEHDKLSLMIKMSHWFISPEAFDTLKAHAAPKSADLPAVTENAIVSALIWQHVSRARELTKLHVVSSSLLSSVNTRRRMVPPLAVEYPHNAIVLARAIATAEELETSSEGALYSLARKVGDSIDWWTSDQIWGMAGAVDHCESVGNRMIPPMDYDLLVTSPSRLGDLLGQSEWGTELGPVQALRWAFPAFMDGFVIVLPGLHGGLELMLWLGEGISERLKEDSEWTRLVERLG